MKKRKQETNTILYICQALIFHLTYSCVFYKLYEQGNPAQFRDGPATV